MYQQANLTGSRPTLYAYKTGLTMGKTKAIELDVPQADQDGAYLYADVLPYLACVFYKKIPNYKILFGLASYAMTQNGLTDKQQKIANDFVAFAKTEGLL